MQRVPRVDIVVPSNFYHKSNNANLTQPAVDVTLSKSLPDYQYCRRCSSDAMLAEWNLLQQHLIGPNTSGMDGLARVHS